MVEIRRKSRPREARRRAALLRRARRAGYELRCNLQPSSTAVVADTCAV